MAENKKDSRSQDTLDKLDIDLTQAMSGAENFFLENRKSLSIIAVCIIVMGLFYLGYLKLYLDPREEEAQNQIFKAEQYFETDSLDKALNGDGNYPGFLGIMEQYSGTKSANLSSYYAGISYLRKGEFQKAIDFLDDYSPKDALTGAVALGAIGDAYSELKNYSQAASYYKKASDKNLEGFTPLYLMKLALVYQELKDNDKALQTYKKIKTEYPNSSQAPDTDKYIALIEAKKG